MELLLNFLKVSKSSPFPLDLLSNLLESGSFQFIIKKNALLEFAMEARLSCCGTMVSAFEHAYESHTAWPRPQCSFFKLLIYIGM